MNDFDPRIMLRDLLDALEQNNRHQAEISAFDLVRWIQDGRKLPTLADALDVGGSFPIGVRKS